MNPRGVVDNPLTSPWSMYRAIVGIGVVCALLIVTVFQTTESRIRENQDRALKRAISEVLPEAAAIVSISTDETGRLQAAEIPDLELPAFLAYDADGQLIGAALSAKGMGYQDTIRLLYAYSFARHAITGFEVLESRETPGLGDRIETEPHFLANFAGLDVGLTADGKSLMHPIETVPQGEKNAAWQLDGITGATISSVAVGKMLNESAGAWIPVLERDAAAFPRPDAGEEP